MEHGVATADPAGPEHRVFVDGTKLEIIDTHALPGGAADIEAPLPRLFVLGHRWALESAEQLRVLVAGSDVDVVLPVAAPAALIATKLHAFCDRQQDEKRASDAYDIYRLLQTRDGEGEVARALEGGPSGLAALVADVMHERFVEGAARVVRYLKVFGDPLWEEIRSEDLQDVVGAFTLHLRG